MAELGKVLVLSASAGAGHLRAAQAVERALIGMGAVREVRHIDVLEYTNKLFRNFYSKAYIDPALTRLGRCFGALYARPLTRPEAIRAAHVAGVELPAESTDVTIAEIFNRRERSIESTTIGFPTRVVSSI